MSLCSKIGVSTSSRQYLLVSIHHAVLQLVYVRAVFRGHLDLVADIDKQWHLDNGAILQRCVFHTQRRIRHTFRGGFLSANDSETIGLDTANVLRY